MNNFLLSSKTSGETVAVAARNYTALKKEFKK